MDGMAVSLMESLQQNASLGHELWQSQVSPKQRENKSLFYGYGIIYLVGPVVCYIILSAIGFWAALQIYVGTQIICGTAGVGYIWIGWQFRRTYLIIYEGGIAVQHPFRSFRSRIFYWNDIYDALSGADLTLHIKGTRPIHLETRFIGNALKAMQLIRQHIPVPETPLRCNVCQGQTLARLCPRCGAPTCSACDEKNECVACRFHHLNRNAIIALCIGILPFLLMVITFILEPTLTFTSFLTMDLGSPAESAASSLRSYYGVSHLAVSLIFIPYAIAVLIANIKRYAYLRQSHWNGWSILFYIAFGMAILVAFSDISYLIQSLLVQTGIYFETALAGVVIDALFAFILVELGLGRFKVKS